jgi:hypothetical protein
MLSLNIDLDLFSNPKIERLNSNPGASATQNLLWLWRQIGEHCPETGGVTVLDAGRGGRRG